MALKICAISDTHNQHGVLELPSADVLIHCGDATMGGKSWEIVPFIEWIGAQPHAVKIFVPGNHDFDVEKHLGLYKQMCERLGIQLLVDEEFVHEGTKFYGSPWVPNLAGWAFYQDHLGLVSKFNKIPADTNVLITHEPPEGTLDVGPAGNAYHIGSSELHERTNKLYELKLHVFGHIHHGYGQVWRLNHDLVYQVVNAAICTEEYEPTNKPIVVEI